MSLPRNPLLRTQAFVDGEWIDAAAHFDVTDPATGERIAAVPSLSAAAVDGASDAATRAFPAWRDRPAHERAACLAAIAARLKTDEAALAALITAENGKPLADATAEVRYSASFFAWFAGEAVRSYGETIPAGRADQRIVVVREPVGPCALITPWNFPAAMLARKLGAALAAGCTVVAKPASETPLTALALALIASDAGVPAGVFNVVTGEASVVGAALCAHPAIRKIGFTGSTEVGRILMRTAADRVTRISLELGGNAPFIVLADADLEKATAGAMIAKFRGGGQTCVAANRFLVERTAHADFTRRLVEACRALKVGRGIDPGVQVGPMIDDKSVEKVRRLCTDAVDRGAKLLLGAIPDGSTRMVPPIVVDGVTPAMELWREEVFGPVVSITTIEGEADAIALGNDTEAGLVAYVWTRDLHRAERMARALEVGMVGVNEGLVSYAAAPFGGVKQSGFGREGSRHGMDDYQSLKYVMMTV
jgi:succinate-semialdehyde dehydrogenase/glutarate-semialdehyde dehydrogenase